LLRLNNTDAIGWCIPGTDAGVCEECTFPFGTHSPVSGLPQGLLKGLEVGQVMFQEKMSWFFGDMVGKHDVCV
jgi:hypothetical protein